MPFGKNFLWGAATAAYQVEGGCRQDGKGVSVWDEFSRIPGKTFEDENGDVAVDHYNHYREDVALMAEMGLKSYRFSIAWSRIFPHYDGEVNPKGLEFYNNLIDELLKYKITPFITLYHWDLPLWLQKGGGWESRTTVEAFRHYSEVCFRAYGDRVKHWITFNEPIVFIRLGYLRGAHPPGLSDPQKVYQVSHNVNIAHAMAVMSFRKIMGDGLGAKIGITHVLDPAYPKTEGREDLEAANIAETEMMYWYYDPILKGEYPEDLLSWVRQHYGAICVTPEDLTLLKGAKSDFIGINYYKRTVVEKAYVPIGASSSTGREGAIKSTDKVSYCGRYRSIKDDDSEYTRWGWEIYPKGLYDGMVRIKKRYGDIPIYITENGLGYNDNLDDGKVADDYRIEYIAKHLQWCRKAIDDGINLQGYYAWSFIDLLSWLNGFQKRYGFVYVQREKNMLRIKKKSFHWYKGVILSNGGVIKK